MAASGKLTDLAAEIRGVLDPRARPVLPPVNVVGEEKNWSLTHFVNGSRIPHKDHRRNQGFGDLPTEKNPAKYKCGGVIEGVWIEAHHSCTSRPMLSKHGAWKQTFAQRSKIQNHFESISSFLSKIDPQTSDT